MKFVRVTRQILAPSRLRRQKQLPFRVILMGLAYFWVLVGSFKVGFDFWVYGLSRLCITALILCICDCADFEPFTVYRRRTAKKKKSKGKEVAEPLSSLFETRTPSLRKKKVGDGDIGISKSCPMPSKKKQCRDKAEINASKLDLPQDFINKQRAYFAEVDAFELEEEVASGNESN
ncbi:hypothetical protein Goari_009883 [Gossypium aridum]|uniref:Sororin C-terminal region domain-containing protein n=1 Tax=Gossypium aridum TaxID=34290 RepID=A0A7J8XYN7_GOSAI|nr:hypothetical protein [Gossypium aridum]